MLNFIDNLDLNKNELQNTVIHALASAPSSPKKGQVYYNTTDNKLYIYDGTAWVGYQEELTTASTGTLSIDSAPTNNSSNLVTSGGVYSALQSVDALPSQTGHSGEFLTTDGSAASWSSTPMVKGVDYVTAGQKSDTTLGTKATAEGNNTTSSGTTSHAEGDTVVASGNYSHAEGSQTNALGSGSHAEGGDTAAIGNISHAEGSYTVASGIAAHAEGTTTVYDITVSGSANATTYTVDDISTEVIERYPEHALISAGYILTNDAEYVKITGITISNKVVSAITVAKTLSTDALTQEVFILFIANAGGYYSHSEGHNANALADYSHAEGKDVVALGNYSHIEGVIGYAVGLYSHSEGLGSASENKFHALNVTGAANTKVYTVADVHDIPDIFSIVGYNGKYACVTVCDPGNLQFTISAAISTTALSSVDIECLESGCTLYDGPYYSRISGPKGAFGSISHSEGLSTMAAGDMSHAEGRITLAGGNSSHAEGLWSVAVGTASHAEGSSTNAVGTASHAEGSYTVAATRAQHAFGKYNIIDTTGTPTTDGTYVEIVGNGTASDARSNARTLDWSGNEVLAGKLTVGVGPTNAMDVATKQYVDAAIPDVTLFLVTLTESGGTITGDKTYSEISTAASAGKICVAVLSDSWYYLSVVASGYARFIKTARSASDYSIGYVSVSSSDDTWSSGLINVQNKISASGILKGDGSGGVTAAVSGTDYAAASHSHGVTTGGTGLTTMSYKNAVPIGNSTTVTNAMQVVRTASGAFYATAQDGAPAFGTLPVAQGGTGATTLTSGAALIGSGTGAVTTRSITNNTSTATALTANTNLITANTLRYLVNRTTSVAAADTSYTTYMVRGEALFTTDTNPSVNGCIAWTYA